MGIVGAGKSGFKTARRLDALPDVRIAAVAEPNRPTRDAFARAFGVGLSVSDYRRLVTDPQVDVVLICSPPATRHAIALDAFTAGKHVICEHPMAINLDQADEMIEAAAKSGKKLLVNLPARYDPAVQEAVRLIDENEIGYPFMALGSVMENEFDRLNDWHDWVGTWELGGGGVLMRYGSPVIDLLGLLLGPVEAVGAVCTRFAISPLNKAEDSCLLGLEFTNESTAEVAITGAARYPLWPDGRAEVASRMEIYGLDGSILITNAEPRLTVVSRSGGRRSLQSTEISTSFPTDMERDLIDSIIEDKDAFVTAEDARNALQVILAGYKASQMKRRVETFEHL